MLWMLRAGVVASFFCGIVAPACMPKQKTDSQVNYAIGDWWRDADSNLLLAVKENQSVTVCLTHEGRVDTSTLTRDRAHFEKTVRSALNDWFSAIGVNVQILFSEPPCANALSQGKLQVVLHYDEVLFQSRIAQTTSPTLGVFLIGDGGLHLNVRGVLNPSRDATSGYKTTLHELGHAMGLNHSQVAGAVMQPMLSRASSRLTADDIAGLREIWGRVAGQRTATTPTPLMAPSNTPVRLTLRYDSWFKLSMAQSFLLPESEKCALRTDQKIVVQILDRGTLQSGHLRIALVESLPGCSFANAGAVGFLYRSHID